MKLCTIRNALNALTCCTVTLGSALPVKPESISPAAELDNDLRAQDAFLLEEHTASLEEPNYDKWSESPVLSISTTGKLPKNENAALFSNLTAIALSSVAGLALAGYTGNRATCQELLDSLLPAAEDYGIYLKVPRLCTYVDTGNGVSSLLEGHAIDFHNGNVSFPIIVDNIDPSYGRILVGSSDLNIGDLELVHPLLARAARHFYTPSSSDPVWVSYAYDYDVDLESAKSWLRGYNDPSAGKRVLRAITDFNNYSHTPRQCFSAEINDNTAFKGSLHWNEIATGVYSGCNLFDADGSDVETGYLNIQTIFNSIKESFLTLISPIAEKYSPTKLKSLVKELRHPSSGNIEGAEGSAQTQVALTTIAGLALSGYNEDIGYCEEVKALIKNAEAYGIFLEIRDCDIREPGTDGISSILYGHALHVNNKNVSYPIIVDNTESYGRILVGSRDLNTDEFLENAHSLFSRPTKRSYIPIYSKPLWVSYSYNYNIDLESAKSWLDRFKVGPKWRLMMALDTSSNIKECLIAADHAKHVFGFPNMPAENFWNESAIDGGCLMSVNDFDISFKTQLFQWYKQVKQFVLE